MSWPAPVKQPASRSIFFATGRPFAPRQVLGTYYNHARMRWERQPFPLPDVLYDRCASESPRAETIRRLFAQWGIIP